MKNLALISTLLGAALLTGCGAGSPEPAVPPSGGEAPAVYDATPKDRTGNAMKPAAPKPAGGDVYTGPSGGTDRK